VTAITENKVRRSCKLHLVNKTIFTKKFKLMEIQSNRIFWDTNVKHYIRNGDITFSNSQIEAFNKVLKHQFLHPKEIANRKELLITLENDIQMYNSERPQASLKGSTPNEIYNSLELNLTQISKNRINQRKIRLETNQKGGCGSC